jgi:uncharacterized protein (TIGR02611 family)
MVRIARIGAGLGMVLLGILLLALPGPGILTIAGGLAILAVDFEWARNLLDWMKSRFADYFTRKEPCAAPQSPAGEKVPR